MNIYFSGIGGVGIGPLAEIAFDAGYTIQGSDTTESALTKALRERGVALSLEQNGEFLQECYDRTPIDWFVHTAALPADHPELLLAKRLGIKTAKRDELLARIIEEKKLKLIAVAGTHGKNTTTGMLVWALNQLDIPISYSVGTTLSFGPSGRFDPHSKYFVYECDEYDRNFLHFHPLVSIITSLDYDHPDSYPTKEAYLQAFSKFTQQSDVTVMWQHDNHEIEVSSEEGWLLQDHEILDITLPGLHNRQNATLAAKVIEYLQLAGHEKTVAVLEKFPGTSRRFEKLAEGLYSDYGHHPVEIAATLQLAREVSDHVILVYQPHQNIRQHEIRGSYTDCFELAEEVYWLPTYLTREDPGLPVLSPADLSKNITNKEAVTVADLNEDLWDSIQRARDEGKLVLCMGAGTIDSWIREQLNKPAVVSILVVDKKGNFVMQKRDNIPGITNPDMVTGFGGHVDPDDTTLRRAATRELHEETNLSFSSDDLRYFKTYRKTVATHHEDSYVTFYLLSGVLTEDLEVYEGQGFEIVTPHDNLDALLLSPLARHVLTEYKQLHGN